jgi:predicted nucleotidyltransferase
MPLSDNQITKWSRRGDPIHAWYSYQMVRDSLAAAKLDGMTYTIYPQGSYANKTNIAADSDVDMVIALRSAFYPNMEELKPEEREEYVRHYERSDLTWQRFRDVVVSALKSNYLVQESSKCAKVRSNLIRLPADVLIALDYKYYTSFPSFEAQASIDGVQFYSSKGTKIINYPKRHITSCRLKNSGTGGRFRPVVRVGKNARNTLISDGEANVRSGTAPSYFLESLLWNVPDRCYTNGLEEAYRQVIGWLHENPGQLASMDYPNKMGKLFGDAPDTVWNAASAQLIIDAMYLQLSS